MAQRCTRSSAASRTRSTDPARLLGRDLRSQCSRSGRSPPARWRDADERRDVDRSPGAAVSSTDTERGKGRPRDLGVHDPTSGWIEVEGESIDELQLCASKSLLVDRLMQERKEARDGPVPADD